MVPFERMARRSHKHQLATTLAIVAVRAAPSAAAVAGGA